jgi:hypothetical protein
MTQTSTTLPDLETRISPIPLDAEIERLTGSFTGREWVFGEIDTWLRDRDERFFILTGEPGVGKSAIAVELTKRRKDIAAYHFCIAFESGTIQPNSVLLSLAAQLIEYFPKYAETLANVTKELKLSVKVEINAQIIKDSTIEGVVIKNLHTQNPQETLDIVLRQTLKKLPNQPSQPVLILIDSLDEAVTHSEQENLVTLLSGANDLPSWVRFLLTSRPDENRVLSYLKVLKPYHYHLNELSSESLNDIHNYLEGRVQREQIQNRLRDFQTNAKALVEQITELSKGNFLYTKLLVDDIETGRQSLDEESLTQLPKSLDELYHKFLLRLKPEWENKYQIIFQILAVAKSTLSKEEIFNFITNSYVNQQQTTETQLNQALGVIRQFLDVAQDDKKQERYRLFHQSFQDYLLHSERNPKFWCSSKDGHRLIVEYCWQYHPNHWQECDHYGLLYLVAHLVDLAAIEKLPFKAIEWSKKLHELLAADANGINLWFSIKKSKGFISNYLTDVRLAWQQAEAEFNRDSSSYAIGLQCRYALITASVNSLTGNLPVELLIELIKRNSTQELTYLQQLISNQQVQDLTALTSLHLDSELGQKLIEMAESLSDKDYQTQVRCALAQYLPKETLPELLKAIKVISNEQEQAQALTILAPCLSSEDLLSEALETAITIQKEDYRAKALIALVPYLSTELRETILKLLREFEYGDYRADVLIKLVPYMPENLLSEVLESALDISVENEYARTRVLSGIATTPQLSKTLRERILEVKECLQQEGFRIQVLSSLAPHLPEHQLPEILQKIQTLPSRYDPAMMLVELASQLPSHQLDLVLETARTLPTQEDRDIAISGLVSHLPLEKLHTVLDEIQDEYYKYQALRNLATVSNLTKDIVEEIKQLAEDFQNLDYRAQVIAILAPHLSTKFLQEVAEEIQTIHDKYEQVLTRICLTFYLPSAEVLNHLNEVIDELKHLSEQERYLRLEKISRSLSSEEQQKVPKLVKQIQQKVLNETRRIRNEEHKALILSELANDPNLSVDVVDAIQQEAKGFQNRDSRTLVFSALFKHPCFKSRRGILKAALAIELTQDRVQALSSLISYVSSNQQQQILKAAKEISRSYYRFPLLKALAVYLSQNQREKILEESNSIQDDFLRADLLSALVHHISSEQQWKVWEQTKSIQEENPRVQVLSELASAPNVTTEVIKEIQQSAKEFYNPKNRLQVQIALAHHLSKSQIGSLLLEIQALQYESEQTALLQQIIPHLSPTQLQEAMKMARVIQSELDRRNILGAIAATLAKLPSKDLPSKDLHTCWTETLHTLASRSRIDLLFDLQGLRPILLKLGNHQAIVEVCDAIKFVGQQWQ